MDKSWMQLKPISTDLTQRETRCTYLLLLEYIYSGIPGLVEPGSQLQTEKFIYIYLFISCRLITYNWKYGIPFLWWTVFFLVSSSGCGEEFSYAGNVSERPHKDTIVFVCFWLQRIP